MAQLKRGYSVLSRARYRKSTCFDKTELYKQSMDRKQEVERISLVLICSSLLPNVHDIVFKQVHVLYQSERMERDYASPPLIAYRSDANLCNMLVHGKTNRIRTQHSCTCDEGCIYCAGIPKSDILVTSKQVT